MQKVVQPKVTVEKEPKRAGAIPLFGSQSAQKFCPGRSRPSLHSGAHVFFVKGRAASLLAVKFSSSGEVAFTPLVHRNLTCYFTLDRAHHYGTQSDESSRRAKLCAAQTAREAGATHPLTHGASRLQCGRSRPHRNLGATLCAVACTDLRICQTRALTLCMKTKG